VKEQLTRGKDTNSGIIMKSLIMSFCSYRRRKTPGRESLWSV